MLIGCESSDNILSPYIILMKLCNIIAQRNYIKTDQHFVSSASNLEINCNVAFQIILSSCGVIYLLLLLLLKMSTYVVYIKFNTDLNLHKYKKTFIISAESIYTLFSFILFGIFLCEYEKELILLLFLHFYPVFLPDNLNKLMKIFKVNRSVTSASLLLYIFSVSVSPVACILCLSIFQIWCYSYIKHITQWLTLFLILISNDIHMNPGPRYRDTFFSFMSWNLNSLAKKDFERIDLIEAHNVNYKYDLISICETSLNDSIELNDILLRDYTFIAANNPANTRHGGVGIFYKNSLPVIVRHELSFDESIVLELNFGRKKIFFTVLYRSPSFNHLSPEFSAFLINFENLYSQIKAESPLAMFFTGDFNAHSQLWWPNGDTNHEGTKIEALFSKLGLSQMISEPTNFQPNSDPSCIDLIVTDQPNIILSSGTRSSLDSTCHHQIIHCKVNFTIPPPTPFERKIWHYNRADVVSIKKSINNFPWLQHLSINPDPNWQVKTFTEIILNIMSNFIPNETKKIIPRDPPWITKKVKTMLNRKNRLYKSYKRNGYKENDKVRLNTFRVECQQAVEIAKLSYLKSLGNNVNDPLTSQKVYWKIIQRVMNKCRTPKIPPLIVNGAFIILSKVKAIYFNEFFSKQCKLIINDSVLPILTYFTNNRLDHFVVDDEEIILLIRKLNPNKASGSDGISGHMLLICDDSISIPLRIIYNNILSTSLYPNTWKIANVTPVFKKGDKQLIKNYRPISLLPICGKILEKIIFNQLYNYLNTNNLITKNQSGFRPGDSTTNQLLYLIDEIHQAFDCTESFEVRSVFLDISKAFDKVWHEGLIFKLEQNGISGHLLKLLQNYLDNRKQRVALNGSVSELSTIESGVPQGSILGPLLFLIYINDLEKNIKSNIKFFADDTMLFSVVQDPYLSANDLNHDLDVISKWAHQWKLEFNPDPSKQAIEVLFSCKRPPDKHPPIFFNGIAVTKLKEHQHLGLTLEFNLSFSKHIAEKIKKAKKQLGMIKYLARFLPLKTLDQMYKTLVRHHLDYCDVIYHIPSTQTQQGGVLHFLMKELEKVQYQAALAITGTWQGSNQSKLYEELGWESLSDRRWCRRILQTHKIVNDKTPLFLKNKLPRHRRPLYRRQNDNTFYEKKANSERYKNSFFNDGIRSWNTIITYFSKTPSISILKNHLLSLIRPEKKSIFNIHDPVGLRYLFYLRVGLSPLRYHKNHHGFLDTPLANCLCQRGIEDTSHFLFVCPLYATERVILVTRVTAILQKYNLEDLANQCKLYLYGERNIELADNRIIILSTMNFIKETQRFTA